MPSIVKYLLCVCLMLLNSQIYADAKLITRPDVKHFISDLVRYHHFDKQQLLAILQQAAFQPQIIESMNKPYEQKPWNVYKELFLTPQRVAAGIEFWQANYQTLLRAQQQFGVPAEIIVAIIGVETFYGKHQGNYRVLDALTTLAFDYPKRAAFFTKELREYLLLCRELKASATYFMGSYAGAIGKPQFMPSSYRFYAVDFTGDGKRDLINNDADVIGSVANFLQKHGWQVNQPVGTLTSVQGYLYKKLNMNGKSANYSFNQLVRVGFKPLNVTRSHPARAGIIELMAQNGPEYWMVYPNFFVIKHYNSSPQYVLAVYLLSQELHKQWHERQNSA
ncbi:MAG: lytic murein transglycosylase B [Legionella sp.]